jgi:hypothetical protein
MSNLPNKRSIFVEHALFRLPDISIMYLVYDTTLKNTRRKNCIKLYDFNVLCYLDDLFLTKEKTYKRNINENLEDFLIRFEKEICSDKYLISKRMIKKIKKMIPPVFHFTHSISLSQLISNIVNENGGYLTPIIEGKRTFIITNQCGLFCVSPYTMTKIHYLDYTCYQEMLLEAVYVNNIYYVYDVYKEGTYGERITNVKKNISLIHCINIRIIEIKLIEKSFFKTLKKIESFSPIPITGLMYRPKNNKYGSTIFKFKFYAYLTVDLLYVNGFLYFRDQEKLIKYERQWIPSSNMLDNMIYSIHIDSGSIQTIRKDKQIPNSWLTVKTTIEIAKETRNIFNIETLINSSIFPIYEVICKKLTLKKYIEIYKDNVFIANTIEEIGHITEKKEMIILMMHITEKILFFAKDSSRYVLCFVRINMLEKLETILKKYNKTIYTKKGIDEDYPIIKLKEYKYYNEKFFTIIF